jgi:hypothetical protein
MKKLLFFFLFFGYFYQTKAQEISFTPNTSHYEIITKLFEGRWDSLKQECVWKPNLAERLQFYVNALDDDFLYTKLEKSFYYETKYLGYITFITSTYSKYKGGEPCWKRDCFPRMSIIILQYNKLKQTIILDRFEKYIMHYGSWNSPPSDITLIQIGEDEYCVKVVDTYRSNGGGVDTFTSLYYESRNILSFQSYKEEEIWRDDDADIIKCSTAMTIDKVSKKITLHKKGIEQIRDVTNKYKTVPIDEIKTYKFNGFSFELVCGN